MDYETTGTGRQVVTAMYDMRSEAQAAVDRIASEGIDRGDIRLVEGNSSTTAGTTATSSEHKGFWESLGDFFMPDEDRYTYAEGLRRGGYLVSVTTTAGNRDLILDILDDEGTVNLDEREQSWRSEGWSGYEADTPGYATTSARSTAGMSSMGATTGLTGTAASRDTLDHDGTIEVVEEELRVGKRDVSHGRVRVRSYVVEEPVTEQVSLREERVDIQRRPVDRAATGDALFRDQTIELDETSEEAVVSKSARVTEEINLNRDVNERTETVSDTVRRTEVEIDDERTGRVGERDVGLTGTTGRTDRKL